MKAGVIGLGDMGGGLASNLLKHGYQTFGFDVSESRLHQFQDNGGVTCSSAAELGQHADAVYVMVMNGSQVHDVLFGENGLTTTLKPGSAIIISATIKPAESRAVAKALEGTGIHLIDSPVSGGYAGAHSGSLTLMAAAPASVMEAFRAVLEAVSANIHHVGTEPGMGQTVKACLQTLIGSIFTATFEASVLAAKSGVSGEVLYNVFSTSGAGCACTNTALGHIVDRQFDGTGSHIATMHKDLTISLSLAQDLGVPLHTASAAMQLFHAGKCKYPDGDNWAVTRVIEDIVGASLHR